MVWSTPTQREVILVFLLWLLLVLFFHGPSLDTISSLVPLNVSTGIDKFSGYYISSNNTKSISDSTPTSTLSNVSEDSTKGVDLSVILSQHYFDYASEGWVGWDDGSSSRGWGIGTSKSRRKIPQTKILAHVPGWTIFDNLYAFNGTLYVVTDSPSSVPDISKIMSKGIPIQNGIEEERSRLPTDKEIRIVSRVEAQKVFGNENGAQVVDGVSFMVNDPPQFITHYYHWSAELWFGFWRTYSALDPSIPLSGNTSLPPPRRLIFTHLDGYHWRDYASMNQHVLRSSAPSATMEFIHDWQDRATLPYPTVFQRVILADRSAAMLAYNYQRFQRTASVPFALPGSVYWWMTIRNSVVRFAFTGTDMEYGETPEKVGSGTTGKGVITYISRQGWGRRMLKQEDHERLVKELYKLRDEYGYEVNVVSMDKLSRMEQLRLAARTTIMMGVHGNGLTSLIWMNPTPRSTVMEFFYPGGFAYDYEYTTRALGMTHFGFWGSDFFTSPDVPQPAYPAGFQGNEIPIDGEVVARLCHERLSLVAEMDD